MPKNIALIPLRKGSKGIPNKNKRKMVGRPLFSWVLSEAIFSDLDEVIVFTDDDAIISFVENQYTWTSKVKAVKRSDSSATDTASTEQAIIEYCESINYNFDSFTLLQATSPFTTKEDINNVLSKLESGFDSVLSVVRTHRFIWEESGNPLNYDYLNRPRRQDFNGLLVENGAIYSTKNSAIKSSQNRLSGNIGLVEMDEASYHEIDSETDWTIVEQLLIERQKSKKETTKISHLVLDVDGVFTAGTISYSKDGELSKEFDMRDGMGLEILREQGVNVMVMTSENSELVAQRMKKLQIKNVFLGVKDKYALIQHLSQKMNFNMSQVAYVGDDVNDLANICSVGWSFAPNNATQTVKINTDILLNNNSAAGAIREACEFILNYNKRFK